ncbi:hypothetical protein NDU88_003931 [Pleurodeles waltl]|uniref:Uncharacterized protein n=1 Tax=Pleurodeles waltl TaxID=8319 RepID=A0AAV7MS06_PLEWA|nr:hypothetical protein NDU88_003931 [Pleurodeles waltl]
MAAKLVSGPLLHFHDLAQVPLEKTDMDESAYSKMADGPKAWSFLYFCDPEQSDSCFRIKTRVEASLKTYLYRLWTPPECLRHAARGRLIDQLTLTNFVFNLDCIFTAGPPPHLEETTQK